MGRSNTSHPSKITAAMPTQFTPDQINKRMEELFAGKTDEEVATQIARSFGLDPEHSFCHQSMIEKYKYFRAELDLKFWDIAFQA